MSEGLLGGRSDSMSIIINIVDLRLSNTTRLIVRRGAHPPRNICKVISSRAVSFHGSWSNLSLVLASVTAGELLLHTTIELRAYRFYTQFL